MRSIHPPLASTHDTITTKALLLSRAAPPSRTDTRAAGSRIAAVGEFSSSTGLGPLTVT